MSFNSTYADCVGVMGHVIVKMCMHGATSSKSGCVIDRQDAFSRP